MSDILVPIKPEDIATPKTHPAETAKDVSTWFKTETLELNFGDSTGRPSSYITLQREYLAQFLQTGWTIDAVMDSGEGGSWVQTGGSTTYSKSQNFYPSRNASTGFGNFSGWDNDLYAQTIGFGFLDSKSGQSAYVAGHLTEPLHVSSSKNIPSADAPAHWTAYQKIRLKRRRLQAEAVMQSMMDSFTGAYNTGRGIEDSRYKEIISLYSLMLNRSENEGNAIVSGSTDLMPLATQLSDSIVASLSEADSSSEEMVEYVITNRTRDVNRQFDNLLATTKAQMITNGTYNSTVWPSVSAGIERQRSEALDKANEAGHSVKFNAKQQVSTLKSQVGAQLLATMQTIATSADQRKITVVELRNNVLKWMLDYIATREEVYPELEEIASIAERMGFSVGSAGTTL